MTALRSVFFGWRVVATAFAVAVFAWGFGFYGPSVFLRTLHETRGWSVAAVSAAVSAHFLLSAALIAWLSDAHRRFGLARVTQTGVVALAAGALAWSLAREPWHLFVAASLSGIGWAATSGAAINAMVAPWFEHRRPAALAMAFNGASIGGVLIVPLWVALIGWLGFTAAAAAIGAGMLMVLLPLTARYLTPTPRGLGLAPDGAAPSSTAAANPTVRRAAPSRAALLRDRRFATLSAAFALALFAQIGVISHMLAALAPRLGDAGAAGAISLATACAIAGRSLLGWLIGGHDRRLAAAANFILQACGVALLAVPATTAALPIAGCILFGLGIGNLISLPPLIAQAEFDRADVPRAVALAVAVNQAVFAFAPGVFGALRDATDGYAAPLAVAVALQLCGAVVVLAGRR